MNGTSAFFVGDAAEIAAAQRAGGHAPAAALYLCATQGAWDECRRRNLTAVLIEEAPLEPEFRKINSWVYDVSFALLDRFETEPEMRHFLDSNFMDVKGVITQAVKTLLVLKRTLADRSVGTLTVFEGGAHPLHAPICRAAAPFWDPGLTIMTLPAPAGAPLKSTGWKASARRLMGGLSNFRGRLMVSLLRRLRLPFFVVSGALNHLAPVVEGLRRRSGHTFIWCENDFNFEKAQFCRHHRLIFLTIPSGTAKQAVTASRYFPEGSAVYEGLDVSGLLDEALREAVERGVIRYAFDPSALESLLKRLSPRGILLDEDFAARRVIFTTSRKIGLPCYVVSHGVPGLLLNGAEGLRARYGSSTTFVHSDFEKSAYEGIYYDPTRLVVSGVPRYDRIVSLTSAAPAPDASRRKKLLYCGSTLSEFDFRQIYTVLGCKDFLGDYSKRYFSDLLNAVAHRKDWFLSVKPHYAEEAGWKALAAKMPSAVGRYEIISHQRSIFDLERTADVILTPESSVICEALMFGKPVIVLGYGIDLSLPYEETGLVLRVRDKVSLDEALRKTLYDKDYLDSLEKRRRELHQNFAGPFDGAGTERVVSVILNAMRAA